MILHIDTGVPDFTIKPRPVPARLSLGDWLPRPFIRRWRTLRKDRRRRAIARHLDWMNDHTLRDIGLNRGEIKMMAHDLSTLLSSGWDQ
jgi:uncharacterized protein YjiS (DUF1127 family)